MAANPTPPAASPDLTSNCCAVTECAPWPLATVEGANHIVRCVSPAFCRLMTQERAQLIGKPFRDLLRENHECLPLLDRVLATGVPESHTQEERSTPDLIFWSYTMWPVMSGEARVGVMIHVTETARFHATAVELNEALVVGAVRQHELTHEAEGLNDKLRAEIQERIWVEDALRASEERFRVLFNLGPVAIFSCDRDGVIQNYNLRAAELWGENRGSSAAGEQFSRWLKLSHGGHLLEHPESAVFEVVGGAVLVKDPNLFIDGPNGSRIATEVTFVPLKDDKGEITGAIIAFYDITERRALEESLAARAADLVRVNRSKDEFLAMLAHELRNPLAPLRNAAEILLESVNAPAEQRDEAQLILSRQIENMSRMIDDLLDVARITEGKIELRRQPVVLAEIIAAAATLARPGIHAREQVLEIALPEAPIFLDGDPTRLEQVFGNLLTNACKYSQSGGRITVSATRREAASESGAPTVVVRVCDEGIGMAPELLPRVFDLFVQATTALDRAYGGLGIGLSLVQRLVKMHGGSVEARSQGLGKGSEFLVRLPVISRPTAAAPATVSSPPAGAILRRILIVDDNEDSARSMAMLQRLRGHETLVAYNGLAALTVAAEFSPEVVLLDIGLPGMDGYEVARQLRTLPQTANALLIAITGYGNPDDRARATAAGFNHYLLKPADLGQLREWLQQKD